MADLSYLSSPITSKFQLKSIVDCFHERVNETPDQEILIHRLVGGHRKSLTYRQLQQRATTLAKYLITKGVEIGDNVGIIGPNSLEWAIGELAILMSGAVAVPLQKTSEDFKQALEVIRATDCKALLIDVGADTDYLSEIEAYIVSNKPLAKKNETILFILIQKPERKSIVSSVEEVLSAVRGDENGCSVILPNINPESTAKIYTTSGSTGVPKQAEFTHFAMVNAAFCSLVTSESNEYGLQYNDRPFNWLGGSIVVSLLLSIPRVFVDTKLSLEEGNIETIWSIIVEEKCASAVFLPSTLADLAQKKDELGSSSYKLKCIITGGQMIGSRFTEIMDSFCEKIFSVYGSTECGVATNYRLEEGMEEGDVGMLLPGYEAKIVGENGLTLRRGEIGEILLRSPFTMKGYQNAPELNRASFTDDKWLRTGDIGIITIDDKLYVKGKAKDAIKRGCKKILSSEVESVIAGIDGVTDVVVFPVPDVRLFEEVCASFVMEDNTNTTEQDIRHICKGKLGDNILGNSPSFYLKFPSFPRLQNGKTDKLKIREQALKMLNID